MVYLNDKIITYLTINNILYVAGDYMTGQIEGQPEQIIYWNTEKLGAEPTQTQLDDVWLIYKNQKIAAQNKIQAEKLLQETDWTQYPDVSDQTKNPHLINLNEWIDYRVALRAIAVNPPEAEITNWPIKPQEQWSS